jgi:branched-chain amino acid transport system permease protein
MTTMDATGTTDTGRRTSEPTAVAGGFAAWRGVVRVGLLGAIVGVYLCVVGIAPVFSVRPLVDGVISLGQAALLLTTVASGYLATLRAPAGRAAAIAAGAIAGLISGGALSLLVLIGAAVDLRAVLLNASPVLYGMLTLNMGTSGFWAPAVVGGLLGALAGVASTLPLNIRKSLFVGLVALTILGLFAGLVRTPLLNSPLSDLGRLLFAQEGLTPVGAVLTLVIATGAHQFQRRYRIERRIANMPADRRRTAAIPAALIAGLLILGLPQGLGPFFAQVIAIVAIYILMGFGLNVTLGLAGLLDLGFVAFFAVGAYTVGLLTSTAEYGIADWPFWAAVVPAVLIAMAFGAILGLPILSIRGDYLAIATLGFGEIIRILAGSDLLKPLLGGPRGIINIPKPIEVPPDHFLAGPNQIYYIALVCAAVVAFVAWRLRASRLGRAWVAIREDEDVAEAIGINLVQTKLLAYMLGAAFAGLGGAIFAALVGSIFASSIQLFVSINVVSLIIVGGMGSIPGVVVGAIFLIGLPELFREFSEYRFLFYGIALIAMMRFRPEGLLPSRIVRREFHVPENEEAPGAGMGSLVAQEEAS